MKPHRLPLNRSVREGLRMLAGYVEAGSSADILGQEYEHMGAEQKQDWDNIEKAVRWIWSLGPEREDPKRPSPVSVGNETLSRKWCCPTAEITNGQTHKQSCPQRPREIS